MLKFQRGSAEIPSGNLLVYCRVKGPNPFHPDASMIVSNVVVSFVSAAQNSFPVVIFPPGPVFHHGEFQKLLKLNDRYDVIRVPDFAKPDDTSEEDYVRERLEQLNKCVLEYVELCRKHVELLLGSESEAEGALFLEADTGGSGPNEDDALRTLGDNLERAERGESIAERELGVALALLHSHPHYDVERFERALRSPDTIPIARLYVQKYRAVRQEQYEEAAGIKARIEEMESRTGS